MTEIPHTPRPPEEIEQIRGGARNHFFWLEQRRQKIGPDAVRHNRINDEIERVAKMIESCGASPIDPLQDKESLLREARRINPQGWLNGKDTVFGKNS